MKPTADKFALELTSKDYPESGGRSDFGMIAELFIEQTRLFKFSNLKAVVRCNGKEYPPKQFVEDFTPSIVQQYLIFGHVLNPKTAYSYETAWEKSAVLELKG